MRKRMSVLAISALLVVLLCIILALNAPTLAGKGDVKPKTLGLTQNRQGRGVRVVLDSVLVATDTSHTLINWGPVSTRETGGGYGGATLDYCRTVWGGSDFGFDLTDWWAEVTLDGKGSARIIKIKHLNGVADDSFDVYAKRGDGDFIFVGHYTYSSAPQDKEKWFTTEFDLYAAFSTHDIGVGLGKSITVRLESTAPAWAYWYHYGQVAIHEIALIGNGQPGV